MKLYTSDFKPFPKFPISSLKSISTFTTQKNSLMKPDTFDFKPSLLPATPIPSQTFFHSSHLILNRKTLKTINEAVRWNKTNEISGI